MAQRDTLEWAEELPSNCPPELAFRPNGQAFYRLVSQFPPAEKDFLSHRKLFPGKEFRTDECRTRAISLFASQKDCEMIKKLPTQRNNTYMVSLVLKNCCGVILQTGKKSHHSWWRVKNYNPIPDCKLVS